MRLDDSDEDSEENENGVTVTSNNNENDTRNDDNSNESNKVSGEEDNISSEEIQRNILDDYTFPEYMAICLWGPFSDNNDRLNLFQVYNAKKDTLLSRAASFKLDQIEKSMNRTKETSHVLYNIS